MSVDLGLVSVLGADAVGKPGHRRFRAFIRNEHKSAILWMEKEQLAGIAEAIDRSLAYITDGHILRIEARANRPDSVTGLPADFPSLPSYDFQVDHMRLSFSESEVLFSLFVISTDIIAEHGAQPSASADEDQTLFFSFGPALAQELSSAILLLLSAGRPVCPLCHTPLDGGPHACVKQNGHREILRIEEQGEDL